MSNEDEIREALDKIVELQEALSQLMVERKKVEDYVMPKEVKAKLNEIADEFDPQINGIGESISNLQNEIRASVIALGHSVKGVGMQAVFTKGRVSWDTKALDRYCITHPEISYLRDEGRPSVSMRVVSIKADDMIPEEIR